MTTNYSRGADFEYKICRDLKAKGYDCQRSAGSHSPVDIWAVPREGRGLICVQAKLHEGGSSVARGKFQAFCARAGAIPVWATKVKDAVLGTAMN